MQLNDIRFRTNDVESKAIFFCLSRYYELEKKDGIGEERDEDYELLLEDFEEVEGAIKGRPSHHAMHLLHFSYIASALEHHLDDIGADRNTIISLLERFNKGMASAM